MVRVETPVPTDAGSRLRHPSQVGKRLDCLASRPHYLAHLRPIWEQLPDHLRGELYTPSTLPHDTSTLAETVMVAGHADAQLLAHHRLVYLEHGAGQRYLGDPLAAGHGSYAGGKGLDHVALFLCPSRSVAKAWLDRYPKAHAYVVGCPRLDRWADGRHQVPGRVVLQWHWDCRLVYETTTAFHHYQPHLDQVVEAVRAAGGHVLLHWHPRLTQALEGLSRPLAALYEPDLERCLGTAAVWAGDNSSVMYEAAALGIPVVAMNAPQYRRDVEHGLRFWSHVPGPQVDDAGHLAVQLAKILQDGETPDDALLRRRAAATAYHWPPGGAAARAVRAIAAVL